MRAGSKGIRQCRALRSCRLRYTVLLVGLSLAGCPAPVEPLDAAMRRDAPRADVPETPDTHVPRDAALEPGSAVVTSFGVQGFLVSYGGESVLTAPLFTRQGAIEVGLGIDIEIDEPAIDAGLAGVDLDAVHAIVSGHAHYDHLLDVVHVLPQTTNATLYTNTSGRNIFAALAPDRDAACTSTPPVVVERARVVAVDDPLASHVDYTNCPDLAPPGAPLAGSWIAVPGSSIRLMPICTTHPPQLAGNHFGEGSVDVELCDLPTSADGWLEGRTISFLIDFLDGTGAPSFRVFYQDAPATRPVGEVPAAILAERRVDLALLCVGSYDATEGQPTDIITNLDPRFVVSGHWEDFFRPREVPIMPLLLLDLDTYVMRAEAALAAPPDGTMIVDGEPHVGRHVLSWPGLTIGIPPSP